MIKNCIYIFLAVCLFSLVACEDAVDFNPNEGKPVVIVEGWISNLQAQSDLKLYLAKPFATSSGYTKISGATITLTNNAGFSAQLKEVSEGVYRITGTTPRAGMIYNLDIHCSYGDYTAQTEVRRNSLRIDSLGFEYQTEGIGYNNDGYYPTFSASEREGKGDYVLMKLYKNGRFLNRSRDINVLEDRLIDGQHLINSDLDIDSGLVKGDLLRVEVWSLDRAAYNFWQDVRDQLSSGFIFSPPMSNTRSNLEKKSNSSAEVNGFFGASLVTYKEKLVGDI